METQLDNFTDSIITGELNINNIDFINNCIEICKNEDTNLLFIYSIIKNGIEEYYKNIININTNIKSNITKNIKEWGLNISPFDIFNNDDDINIDKYNNFLHENMIYNELNKEYNNIKLMENINENTLINISKKIKRSIDIINKQINLFKSYILIIEPNYNYLIIDLSNIKIDNLNNILINYIYIINYIKKEFHYLISLYTSIFENLLKMNYDIKLQYNKLTD